MRVLAAAALSTVRERQGVRQVLYFLDDDGDTSKDEHFSAQGTGDFATKHPMLATQTTASDRVHSGNSQCAQSKRTPNSAAALPPLSLRWWLPGGNNNFRHGRCWVGGAKPERDGSFISHCATGASPSRTSPTFRGTGPFWAQLSTWAQLVFLTFALTEGPLNL